MAQKTDYSRSFFERFSNAMDNNTKGVKVGCYSVALIGLTLALRRVRPFSRFKRPLDIPKRFVKERRELVGTVERIEPNGALLMIHHKPIIALPGVSQGELPVKIAGINVSGHGISWLQTLVSGNEVVFVPVSRTKEFVACEVKMRKNDGKKTSIIDLGESLVSVGFGGVIERSFMTKDPNYQYYMRLKSAEESALKKRMGVKYYIKPTGLILAAATRQLQIIVGYTVKKIVAALSSKRTMVAAT